MKYVVCVNDLKSKYFLGAAIDTYFKKESLAESFVEFCEPHNLEERASKPASAFIIGTDQFGMSGDELVSLLQDKTEAPCFLYGSDDSFINGTKNRIIKLDRLSVYDALNSMNLELV